ncbi:unnamed protein product [Lampetra fluviatilis]
MLNEAVGLDQAGGLGIFHSAPSRPGPCLVVVGGGAVNHRHHRWSHAADLVPAAPPPPLSLRSCLRRCPVPMMSPGDGETRPRLRLCHCQVGCSDVCAAT